MVRYPEALSLELRKAVTLDVQNPEQFKVAGKGDQVDATYTEALAPSVEPAPKAAPAKKWRAVPRVGDRQ